MKPARLPNHRDAGFTLLELLIAITILALLLVALSGGLHFAGRAWRKQEESIGRQGDINAVQSVLRQMLASGRDFEGGPRGLKFVGRMPMALARGGLFDVELSATNDKMVLSWRSHFKGPGSDMRQSEIALLTGVAALGFSYYAAPHGWQQQTNDKSKAPDLVAIKARLSDGRIWPPLAIPPAITAPATSAPAKPKS